jgi:nicotinamidase-related amidase
MAPKSFRQLLGMPDSTASPTDSALIIIDAQNEYASGALTVTNAESSGKVIADLLEKYRKAGGKIVHVLHKTPEGAPVFTPNTELAEEFKDVKAKVVRNDLKSVGQVLTKTAGRRRSYLENVPWLVRGDET